MDVRVAWAENVTSDPPCILGILRRNLEISVVRDGGSRRPHFQITTFSAGTYLALPLGTLHSTLVVLSGVGTFTTRLEAESLASKLVLMVMVYETPVVPISFTVANTLMGSFTLEVER